MDVKSQACFVSVDMLAMSFILHQLQAISAHRISTLYFFLKIFNKLSVSVKTVQRRAFTDLQEVPNVVICLGNLWYFKN